MMRMFLFVCVCARSTTKFWWKSERNIWTIRGTRFHFMNKNISIFIRKLAKFTTNSPVWNGDDDENRRMNGEKGCGRAKGFLFSRTDVACKSFTSFYCLQAKMVEKWRKWKQSGVIGAWRTTVHFRQFA